MKYRYVSKNYFDRKEVIDLIKSTLVIGAAFAFLLTPDMVSFPFILLISLITAGAGFFLHEMAHKFFALKYGAEARFVANNRGLLFAVAFVVLFKVLFAAPGAVVIRGQLSKQKFGITALAGPVTNMVLAFLFLGLSYYWQPLVVGFTINAVLAAFNMLPLPPFDGQKVWKWNRAVYIVFAGIALLLYIGLFAL